MDVPLTFCPRGWMFVMKKSSSHGSYQKCFPPLTAIEVGFWETRMQGKVAANKDFLMKSSIIESNFNVSKQRYVQTVLGNYYPLAREVCEAGSTLPCGKNQGNVLINISYNCRAFDDNTVLFLCHSLHKVISANTIPEMWKGGEEVLRNVWEDGRRYLCKIWLKSCQILVSIFCSLKTFGGGVPMKSSPSKLPPSAARLAYLSAHMIWLIFFKGGSFGHRSVWVG